MSKEELDGFIKWILGGLILFAAIYFFPWGTITWGRIILQNQGLITVTGYAEATEKNQIAQFSAGVNALNADKTTAVNEVNTKMAALIKAVKASGVADADIKTQQISVYQMQERIQPMMYPQPAGKVTLGQWNASNTVEITLRDVAKAGSLADILTASGANNIYGPNFQLDNSQAAQDKLVGAAVADAKVKAEAMAAASGAKLDKVISINEYGQSPIVYPMMAGAGMAKSDLAVPAPTEVGTTKLSKTVTVVWSLK